MEILEARKNKGSEAFTVTARERTWTNQRRKRREKMRAESLMAVDSFSKCHADNTQGPVNNNNNNNNNTAEAEGASKTRNNSGYLKAEPQQTPSREEGNGEASRKRSVEAEYEDETESKKMKKEEDSGSPKGSDDSVAGHEMLKRYSESDQEQSEYVVKLFVNVRNIEPGMCLEMQWLEGTGGRECLHQVMQYIKNNLK